MALLNRFINSDTKEVLKTINDKNRINNLNNTLNHNRDIFNINKTLEPNILDFGKVGINRYGYSYYINVLLLMFRNIPCFSEYILDVDVKDDGFLLDIDVKDDESLLDVDVKDDEFLIIFKDCIKSLIFKTEHYYPKELFIYF